MDNFGAVAMARQTDAQIGVFGHVVGIPAAQFFQRIAAEKQRGAAQRNGKAQPLQPRQEHAKPCVVFHRKTARQPVGARVVEIQQPLQTGHLRPAFMEPAHDLVNLVGVRGIFGVINPDDRATAEIQREIHRPRFGAHSAGGHFGHAHPMRQMGAAQGFAGGVIVGLDHQTDIQQFFGVVQAF